MKNIVYLCIVFISLLTLCSLNVNAQIESLSTSKLNTYVQLTQAVTNSTYCNLTKIQYPNNTIISIGANMTKNGNDYNYTYFTNALGEHSYITCCNPDGVETCVGVTFDVTTTGNISSIVTILFYVGLMIVLIFFLFLSISSFVKFDNLLNRVGMIGLSYGLLIAITFIAWQMANDFLSNATYITDFMYMLFSILMWGVLPMLVGAFAWWLLMTMRIKEMEELMEKGIPMDEAEQRIRDKHKSRRHR